MSAPMSPALLEVPGIPATGHRYGLFSAATAIKEEPAGPGWLGRGITYPVVCDPPLPSLPIPCLNDPADLERYPAFRAAWSSASANDYITVTLARRDPRHDAIPLVVTIGDQSGQVDTVGGTVQVTHGQPVGGTFDVTFSIAPAPGLPGCSITVELVRPNTGSGTAFHDCFVTELAAPGLPDWDEPGEWVPTMATALPWHVQGDTTCRPPGRRTEAEMEAAARERLALAEQLTAERRFQRDELVGATVLAPASGTSWSLCQAVGALEAALTRAGMTSGVLHAPRHLAAGATAVRLARPAPEPGPGGQPRLEAPLGEPWAFGAGYLNVDPTGLVDAPAGQAWVYATGPVMVRRTAVEVTQALDPYRNELTVRAERSYVVGAAGCRAYAALVQVPDC